MARETRSKVPAKMVEKAGTKFPDKMTREKHTKFTARESREDCTPKLVAYRMRSKAANNHS